MRTMSFERWGGWLLAGLAALAGACGSAPGDGQVTSFILEQMDDGDLPPLRLVITWYHPDKKGAVQIVRNDAVENDVVQVSLDNLSPPNADMRMEAECPEDLCRGRLSIAVASVAVLHDPNGDGTFDVDALEARGTLHGLADARIVYSNQAVEGHADVLPPFPEGLVEGVALYRVVPSEDDENRQRLVPWSTDHVPVRVCAHPTAPGCALPVANIF